MINLIKRDFSIILKSKGVLIVILASVPLALFLIGDEDGYSIYAMLTIILVYTITTLSLGLDAKNNSHILFKSLPIKTSDMVISKYIAIFINFILVIGYIFIVAILMDSLKIYNLNYHSISKEIIIYMLTIVIISFSISLPLIFLSSPKVGDFIGKVAMFITMFSGSKNIGSVNNFKFFVGVLIGMIVSMALSIYIYKNREYKGVI